MGNEMKIDLANSWFKGPSMYVAGVLLITATAIYVRMDTSIGQLQEGQNEVVNAIKGMREDMRNLGHDHVSQQQFRVWAELLRAVNGVNLKVPELPK